MKMRGLPAPRPVGFKRSDCSNRVAACTSGDVARFHSPLKWMRPGPSGMQRWPSSVGLGGLGHAGGFQVALAPSFPVTFLFPMSPIPEACSISQDQNAAYSKPAMIDVRNLSKRFYDKKRGEILAVNGVSFRCRPGQIYGLLGANGAGKTTILRMLATILEPTDGTALVCGYDVVENPQKVRANVGFLSTATALYPRLTARELVQYFGRLNGLDESILGQRVDRIFDRLDMNGFRDRRCDKLSTGMKQKTSIARTLVHDPPVMIFDEPTLGLDIMTARTITAFIRECREVGKTVIFSTHIMSEVEKLCDVIGIIQNGQMLAEGTLPQLRDKYDEQDLQEIFVKVVAPHCTPEKEH
jgi:sodium transport system ATP-binding protein